jgi:hypothetical protein
MSRLVGLSLLVTSLTSFVPLATAQSSGSFTIDSTSTTNGTGCIFIAQVASLGSPLVLTALQPICPSDTVTVSWPLTSSGDGASSSLAVYAELTSAEQGGVTAGCVTDLSQMQAMYLLGRSLEWRNDKEQVYDNTAGGYLLDSTSYQPILW